MENNNQCQTQTSTQIVERYEQEVASSSLGCANLWSFLALQPSDSVLDLGCGQGQTAYKMAQRLDETGSVVGLDLTPAMIEEAKKKYIHPQLEFKVGDMHNLPFMDRCFDVITSNCVINHSLQKDKVYAELFRVLKNGGYFLVGDVVSVDELPKEVSQDPAKVAACWGGAIPENQLLQQIHSVGFKSVDILSSRQYNKEGFALCSIIMKGVKE